MINLMIAEDSEVFLKILTKVFEDEKDIKIAALARNGFEAIQLFKKNTPDVVIIDLMLPMMSGFEVINEIVKIADIRKHHIIVFSSISSNIEIQSMIKELSKGLITVIEKPINLSVDEFIRMKEKLIRAIKNIEHRKDIDISTPVNIEPMSFPKNKVSLIVMGGSIGSPGAINRILKSLKPSILLPPLLFIIHIKEGFLKHYIKSLDEEHMFTIRELKHKEVLKSGIVYFAPDNKNVELIKDEKNELMAILHSPDQFSKVVPSVNFTFFSIAKLKAKVIAGILTGMGSDGAQGLLEIKKNHNFTFIEKFDDCVATGMPSSAMSTGAVDAVFALDDIGRQLIRMGSRIEKYE